MSIYERFGVTTIVNAAGAKSRLGGVGLHPEVVEAMADAAQGSIDMAELEAAASAVIARITGAEAGYVTSGAASGLTLAAAACIAGDDPAAIDRLPHTDGMRNEILIARTHRNSYDHAWRAAGARLVDVGVDDRVAGSGMRGIEGWEYEACIGPKTAAIAYVANRHDDPPLEDVVAVARRHGLPVIVDAAAQLPPVSNLRAFVARGADLVSFSGGKAIQGPQASGVLCGRADLIRAVLLSHLDMDQPLRTWSPPPALFPRGLSKPLPRHGLGRSLKAGKEQIVGLLVALERFVARDEASTIRDRASTLDAVEQRIEACAGLRRTREHAHGTVKLHLACGSADRAWALLTHLEGQRPSVTVDPSLAHVGTLTVDPLGLGGSDAIVVGDAISAAWSSVTSTR